MQKPSTEILADNIAKDLRASRELNKSNPQTPVKANTICNSYKNKFGWDISDSDIRRAVNYLRENEIPIGSTLNGYYYVLTAEEWEATLNMIIPKYLTLKSITGKIEKMRNKMKQEKSQQLKLGII